MKYFLMLACSFFVLHLSAQKNVGIGTAAPDASALLDISSSSKGCVASPYVEG